MAGGTKSGSSKTARASLPATKAGAFEYSVDAPRVIPTGNGTCAYVLGIDGKTRHLRVDSPCFVEAVAVFAGTPAVRQSLPVIEQCVSRFAHPGWLQARAALLGEVTDGEPADQ